MISNHGRLTKNTHGDKLKDAVAAKGRVKRGKNYPAAVERRKEIGAQNKAAKAKSRDPFTRKGKYTPIKEMKTLQDFMEGRDAKIIEEVCKQA